MKEAMERETREEEKVRKEKKETTKEKGGFKPGLRRRRGGIRVPVQGR